MADKILNMIATPSLYCRVKLFLTFAETQHFGFLLNTNGADVVTTGKSGGEHEQQNDANVLVHVGNMKE